MAYSSTEIINMALDKFKGATITSMSESSYPASVARRQYPQAVAETLAAHEWGFARQRAVLAQLVTNDRDGQWGYAYQLPSDMALPIKLVEDYSAPAPPTWNGPLNWSWGLIAEQPIPYDYAGAKLYTGIAGASLEYIQTSPDVGDFPPLFVKALVCELAAKMVMPIKNDSKRENELLQHAQVYYERAVANNDGRRRQTYGDFVPDVIAAKLD